MSTEAWVAVGVLAVAVVALVAVAGALRARLRRAEARLDTLEERIGGEVASALAAARADAQAAAAMARRAAGIADPPPKLAFEPVTGRLIKVVALGAGARRAIGRLARRDLERRTS